MTGQRHGVAKSRNDCSKNCAKYHRNVVNVRVHIVAIVIVAIVTVVHHHHGEEETIDSFPLIGGGGRNNLSES